ncbi:hypothetical protein Patl1_12487 [Pistacia atlantica]|uniref:Uncharacterized protein n=1 Tax=Pistacia atlantica TaxID=434234 RepID=A0ACC1AXV9_9ROSI|nr:hypothetical protein Patl1_12487 [Pistacia atlantica]
MCVYIYHHQTLSVILHSFLELSTLNFYCINIEINFTLLSLKSHCTVQESCGRSSRGSSPWRIHHNHLNPDSIYMLTSE